MFSATTTTPLLQEKAQPLFRRPFGDSGIWLRWTEIVKPVELEKELIQQLKPGFNIRLNPYY